MNILPYKTGSRSARLLSQRLGMRRLKISGGSLWKPKTDGSSTVINWGHSGDPWPFDRWGPDDVQWINHPDAVRLASNKYTSIRRLEDEGVRVPDWTDNFDVVHGWLESGKTVLARTLLRASGGRGIVKLQGAGVDIPRAPLYTMYVPKASEWRVHVFRGNTIDIQRKIARPDAEPADWQIRNHDNGFIFQRDWNPEAWNPDIEAQAHAAVVALGLDFGAVDVIWNQRLSSSFVLEVNTAPGLEGGTLDSYVNAIRENVL